MSAENEKNTPETLSFATFLESVPPGAERTISDLFVPVHDTRSARSRAAAGGPPIYRVNTPDIQLHCPSDRCSGVRTFKCIKDGEDGDYHPVKDVFLTYWCRNCDEYFKTYALQVCRELPLAGSAEEYGAMGRALGVALESKQNPAGSAVKYGEIPALGPPLPARLLNMAGADGHLLRKGRRAENQSLGIGAFAYYRRVVENQKNRLLGEFRKAAERLGADEELLGSIDRAREETQFSKAIELVKDAIPDGLKVQGDNPLKLLHGALSKGVHGLDDKECLERAQAVRRVLTELVSNIAQVTKDERKLTEAVKKLQSIS